MIEAITPASYDLSKHQLASVCIMTADTPSVPTETERKEDDVTIGLEFVPPSQVVEGRHVGGLARLLAAPYDRVGSLLPDRIILFSSSVKSRFVVEEAVGRSGYESTFDRFEISLSSGDFQYKMLKTKRLR